MYNEEEGHINSSVSPSVRASDIFTDSFAPYFAQSCNSARYIYVYPMIALDDFKEYRVGDEFPNKTFYFCSPP